jgi:putative ABC transport system permease protein
MTWPQSASRHYHAFVALEARGSSLMLNESLRMSLQVLTRTPTRSALTVLGLAIGVAAFIAMVSFGQGARRAVMAQFESLGVNVLHVRVRAGAGDLVSKPVQPLSDRDVEALRREGTAIGVVVPQVRRVTDLTRGAQRARVTVIGTTPDYLALHGFEFASGGIFDARDDRNTARVCVLGATSAHTLFGDADATGETVTLSAHFACRVIGVLAPKGRGMSGSDQDEILLIPLQTFRQLLGMDGYSSFDLRPARAGWLEPARVEAEQILRRTHHYDAFEPADFDVVSPDDVTAAADQTAHLLTGLLAGIAAVSLLVGGIGIMNIQLVAVAERTHEIGIRAAIGAAPSQILKQFLIESCLLAATGALAGVSLGVGASALVAHWMHWEAGTSIETAFGSAAFGIGVGVLFGLLPALRASRLDPVEALRRE